MVTSCVERRVSRESRRREGKGTNVKVHLLPRVLERLVRRRRKEGRSLDEVGELDGLALEDILDLLDKVRLTLAIVAEDLERVNLCLTLVDGLVELGDLVGDEEGGGLEDVVDVDEVGNIGSRDILELLADEGVNNAIDDRTVTGVGGDDDLEERVEGEFVAGELGGSWTDGGDLTTGDGGIEDGAVKRRSVAEPEEELAVLAALDATRAADVGPAATTEQGQ